MIKTSRYEYTVIELEIGTSQGILKDDCGEKNGLDPGWDLVTTHRVRQEPTFLGVFRRRVNADEKVAPVKSDAATSASILNDAASLTEESRRRVFTAKGLALTAPEVQLEPVNLPTEREITQHQIDVLLTGLDVLAARLIEHATPPRPDDHHFSAEVVLMCELKLGVYPRLGGKGFSVEWLLEIGYHTNIEVVILVHPDDLVKCSALRGWDSLRDKIDSHLNATRMLLAFTPDTLET